MSMFQQRHYERVARVLKQQADEAGLDGAALMAIHSVADAMAVMFHADNPRFKQYLFVRACGFITEESQ